MKVNFQDIKETVRIKGTRIQISTMVITGKEGDYFVAISPTLHISGYGKTEEDARASFTENIDLFCEDLMGLSKEKIAHELFALGFRREPFKSKNFSRMYVDGDGVLHGLEPSSIKPQMVTANC